ncbi:MAG: hypothetical protein ABIH34_01960 [Nanoarchaeota archaeon]
MKGLLIFLLFIPPVFAMTVGVSPVHIDLGDVERGNAYEIEFVIFNPNEVTTSFVFEGEGFVPEKKTERFKGGGMKQVKGMITAPDVTGHHEIPISVMPKGEGAVMPAVMIVVSMDVVEEEVVTLSGGIAENGLVSSQSALIRSSETVDKDLSPNRFVGVVLVASIVGPGLVGWQIVKKKIVNQE